jgi:hypothetical protein
VLRLAHMLRSSSTRLVKNKAEYQDLYESFLLNQKKKTDMEIDVDDSESETSHQTDTP